MPLSLSTGLLRSDRPAKTRPHFKVGAQKCTVLGPVSLCQNLLKANPIVDIVCNVCNVCNVFFVTFNVFGSFVPGVSIGCVLKVMVFIRLGFKIAGGLSLPISAKTAVIVFGCSLYVLVYVCPPC